MCNVWCPSHKSSHIRAPWTLLQSQHSLVTSGITAVLPAFVEVLRLLQEAVAAALAA